jgi:hypothetical protein
MKFITLSVALLGVITLSMISCQKNSKDVQEDVSSDVIAKIAAQGFGTSNVQKVEEGYLVEGDIILTEENLNNPASSPTLRIAEVEQYRTFNLVTGGARTITVSASGEVNTAVSNAINSAIARYNAENLQLTFTRVAGGGDINVRVVNGGNYIASAGFPDNQGDPYGEVKFNRQYQNYSSGFLTTVIAHEMGHCIGFRHTDYMNRSFSCGGSGGNEGSGSVGAVLIPGTPSGPDSGSWMLACLSSTTNRPFNNNDKTALNYLY